MQSFLLFHGNNGCTKALQSYVIRTLPLLLCYSFEFGLQLFRKDNIIRVTTEPYARFGGKNQSKVKAKY
jgi:hypothetical protein